MKEIEILNKITEILEDVDGYEVQNIQAQFHKIDESRNRFSIAFETEKINENVSVPDEPKTEAEENSENDTCIVHESEAPLPECEPICEEEKIGSAEIKPIKKRKKGKYCVNCVNCLEADGKDAYFCCKDLKKYINNYTLATFCDEYCQK